MIVASLRMIQLLLFKLSHVQCQWILKMTTNHIECHIWKYGEVVYISYGILYLKCRFELYIYIYIYIYVCVCVCVCVCMILLMVMIQVYTMSWIWEVKWIALNLSLNPFCWTLWIQFFSQSSCLPSCWTRISDTGFPNCRRLLATAFPDATVLSTVVTGSIFFFVICSFFLLKFLLVWIDELDSWLKAFK